VSNLLFISYFSFVKLTAVFFSRLKTYFQIINSEPATNKAIAIIDEVSVGEPNNFQMAIATIAIIISQKITSDSFIFAILVYIKSYF